MKRRVAYLPLLLVLASAPALRTAARAQDDDAKEAPADDGNTSDHSDDDKPNPEQASSDDEKPGDDADAPKTDEAEMKGDGDQAGDASGEDSGGDKGGSKDKGTISIKVESPEGEKPAEAEVSVSDTPVPKAHKKTSKAQPARIAKGKAKAKSAGVKTPAAVKKAVVPPPPPPPPPSAVPSTPVEPFNP